MGLYRETGTNYEAYLRYTYDSDNNLSRLREYVDSNVSDTFFAYDDDNRVTAIRKNKARAAYTYDKYGRVSQVVSSLYNSSSDNSNVLTESYAYNNMQVTEYRSDSVSNHVYQ